MNAIPEQSKTTQFVNQAFAEIASPHFADQSKLIIWGGCIPAQNASRFTGIWDACISNWPSAWRMIEHVHRFVVQNMGSGSEALPQDWSTIERGRLFCESGDLDLRRDVEQFRWRFIGSREDTWPNLPDEFKGVDFWDEPGNQDLCFREIEQKYYQWQGELTERRVNSRDWLQQARLGNKNVYLLQKQYWLNGRIAFVRYVELKEISHG